VLDSWKSIQKKSLFRVLRYIFMYDLKDISESQHTGAYVMCIRSQKRFCKSSMKSTELV
jgi:hypothetical protein